MSHRSSTRSRRRSRRSTLADGRTAHIALLSTVTGWPEVDIAHLAGPSAFDFAYPDDFGDERPLSRLRPVMDLVSTIGSAAERVTGWVGDGLDEGQAAEIKQAAKARYDPDQWLEIAKPIRDALREQQRDALVAHLLAKPELTGDPSLGRPDDLYRRYLVDVEMSACMPTSRIVQALGAIQLFVQRTLLNLEPGGLINADLAVQWDWMKQYRVWEANRKVFVSPENWIEPELRTDKTPFFKRLEGELMQAEVTAEAAEDALRHYPSRTSTAWRAWSRPGCTTSGRRRRGRSAQSTSSTSSPGPRPSRDGISTASSWMVATGLRGNRSTSRSTQTM